MNDLTNFACGHPRAEWNIKLTLQGRRADGTPKMKARCRYCRQASIRQGVVNRGRREIGTAMLREATMLERADQTAKAKDRAIRATPKRQVLHPS